ncbi:MAG: NUDIX hydrolase, partial [Clostridia bacterium]|nr:NUDIX hydrolase [Clostridia bacterium]
MKKNLNYIESTVKSEKIFDGKVFRVFVDEVQFPDGKKSRREVVSHNGGVCIIAVDDKERVLVEKQYRYALKDYLLELPAGKLEKGEDHKEAGIR